MIRIVTKSVRETRKVADILAREVGRMTPHHALIVGLEGELGAGKTTFVQGFARAFGIRENVLSPTFILMKTYNLRRRHGQFTHLVHIDCYRLNAPRDLVHLGFREIIKDNGAIILIEWADRVRRILPKNALGIRFQHRKRANERLIEI